MHKRRVAVLLAVVVLALAGIGGFVAAQQQPFMFNPAENPASWENPQPQCDPPVVCDGLGTPDLSFGEPAPGSQSSSVSLLTREFTVTEPEGQIVTFATFEFCNGQVLGGTALENADFVVRYAVTGLPLQVFGETVTFINSPNVGDPIADADFLFMADDPSAQFMVLEDECGLVELEIGVSEAAGAGGGEGFAAAQAADSAFLFGPVSFGRVLTPDTAFVTSDSQREVQIDVKPGSDSNPVNLNAKGVVPVAILGSALTDVTNLDPTSILFEGTSPAHKLANESVFVDHLRDVNDDGYLDLAFHVRIQDSDLTEGDTEACATFESDDGEALFGCDEIRLRTAAR